MLAEKVVNSLLLAATGLTTLVGSRVYPIPLPQGVAFPAVGYRLVSTNPLRTIDAAAALGLTVSRVEVVAFAKDYPTQKQVAREIRKACEFKRGTISGVNVVVSLWDSDNPDFRDDDLQLFTQGVDFLITYRDPLGS